MSKAIWDLRLANSSSMSLIFCWVDGSADEYTDTEPIDWSNGVEVLSLHLLCTGSKTIPSSRSVNSGSSVSSLSLSLGLQLYILYHLHKARHKIVQFDNQFQNPTESQVA